MKIESEANFTVWEATSMIIGHSIGTGIIAVPFLATRNSLSTVFLLVGLAYFANVVLHLLIAELSYNNGGLQLVKSFEGELFSGRFKQIFSWIMFVVYGFAIMMGVSGNINGGAQILSSNLHLNFAISQCIYYFIAGFVVFLGMKAVGIAQKYSVLLLIFIVFLVSALTISQPLNMNHSSSPAKFNNILALYSMIVFATSANQAVIQSVKGLNGDGNKIRASIFIGFAISCLFTLLVTISVIFGINGEIDGEMAYMQLGKSISPFATILTSIFSLFALLTTFWSNTLSIRDVVHEQVNLNNKLSWVLATIPSLLFSIFAVKSFIILTRIMSSVVVLVSVMLIYTYNKSRRRSKVSPICGFFGKIPFQIFILISTISCTVGAIIPLS